MYKCERCQKTIEVDQEYEEIATHLFHTSCYIEGLVGAIISSPFGYTVNISGQVIPWSEQQYIVEETLNKDGSIKSRELKKING